jgi:hypothetical protein
MRPILPLRPAGDRQRQADDGKWDGGWIYDPEKVSKYDVESHSYDQKLKVMGWGVKF